MAKTIKEMAQDYSIGLNLATLVRTEAAFIAGANAVLDEIIKYMDEDFFISYQHIRELIKELKG